MIWPFRGRRQAKDLVERVEVLERRLKVVEADWDEWYDKFRHLYARLAKRMSRQEAEEAPNGPAPTRTTNPLAARLLRGPSYGRED